MTGTAWHCDQEEDTVCWNTGDWGNRCDVGCWSYEGDGYTAHRWFAWCGCEDDICTGYPPECAPNYCLCHPSNCNPYGCYGVDGSCQMRIVGHTVHHWECN